jgi:hypothetical protein
MRRPIKPIHFLAKILHEQPATLHVKRLAQHALLVTLDTHQQVAVYLLDSAPDIPALEAALQQHSIMHIYSVFAIPGDCLNDATFRAEVALPLLHLTRSKGNKIYAYTVLDEAIHILPAYHYTSQEDEHHFQYGTPVDVTSFDCQWIEIPASQPIAVADFRSRQFETPRSSHAGQEQHYQGRPYTARPPRYTPQPQRKHYQTLRVSVGADIEQIRHAYRDLAQQYHPDANPDNPAANQRMQEINEAYHQLVKNYRRSKK